jgi:hypothetical protein
MLANLPAFLEHFLMDAAIAIRGMFESYTFDLGFKAFVRLCFSLPLVTTLEIVA